MTDKRLLAGPALVLAAIVVACFFATKDTPARTSIPPRVLDAQLERTGADGARLKVTAQDPDGTIVALSVRWPDGRVTTTDYPCRADDYGGKTITHTFTRRDDVPAQGTQVRAIAESCFGAQPRHTGPWANATTAE